MVQLNELSHITDNIAQDMKRIAVNNHINKCYLPIKCYVPIQNYFYLHAYLFSIN